MNFCIESVLAIVGSVVVARVVFVSIYRLCAHTIKFIRFYKHELRPLLLFLIKRKSRIEFWFSDKTTGGGSVLNSEILYFDERIKALEEKKKRDK